MKTFISSLLLASILISCISCQKANNVEGTDFHSDTVETDETSQLTSETIVEKSTVLTTETFAEESTELTTETIAEESIASTAETTAEEYTELVTTTVEDHSPKHYEIDLNMDNYMSFLNYSVSNTVKCLDQTHSIAGALTYAYYENVVITFEITYETTGYQARSYSGEYSILLNAAGCTEFTADNENLLASIKCPQFDRLFQKTFTIKSIPGKVIYYI